jgi:hypothetical protein
MQVTLSATMREVRPTVFMGVPRVWEKLRAMLESNGFTADGYTGKGNPPQVIVSR